MFCAIKSSDVYVQWMAVMRSQENNAGPRRARRLILILRSSANVGITFHMRNSMLRRSSSPSLKTLAPPPSSPRGSDNLNSRGIILCLQYLGTCVAVFVLFWEARRAPNVLRTNHGPSASCPRPATRTRLSPTNYLAFFFRFVLWQLELFLRGHKSARTPW